MGRCRGDAVERMSTRELFDRIRDLSLGLGALGAEPGDRVAILSDSRPEWVIADLAALTGGMVTAPIYPTLPGNQVRYILADSKARIVVVADETQAAKVRAVWDELPDLTALVIMDPADADEPEAAPDSAPQASGGDAGREELSLADAAERGHRRLQTSDGLGREYKERAAAIGPDDLATIIYTSGTTGEPKGVMLTHGNVASNIVDGGTVVEVHPEDDALSFLPLSHAFERMVVMLYLYRGASVTFAESLDTIARDLAAVRPTVMTGVPRVYEKFQARVLAAVATAPALRRRLFHWAVGVGLRRARAGFAGRSAPLATRLQHGLADRLVLSKVRERLGGRLRFVVSGSAPLAAPIAEFFFAIGIPVAEGYGLTETSPALTVNPLDRPKPGTVGPAIRNVELRIADDGEVLARGPNIMQGYHGKPEATAEVLRDGWFCTGDIGSLDEDGYLTILDRKKELIVTAGGKNIAPNPIEAELKRSPLVAEAVLIGDRRPFVAALLVPDFEALAAGAGVPDGLSREEIVARPDVIARFDEVVEGVNAGLARHEQVKRSALLPAVFGIATGELTPTMKVKRRVVAERWSAAIERLYEESAP